MAGLPLNGVSDQGSRSDGERIVISGMSGLYPQCHHVKDLNDVLYNKVNPISSEGKHWEYSHPEVSQHAGSLPQLDRFDAQFFGVHFRLGNSMDTMSRKMLEQTFQAIYDAGLSPEHLSGKKVGVYVGTCFSETEKASFYVASSRTGFGIAGCSKAMFANRISYWLNAKGPSVAIDEACCSSTAALEQAYQAMSRGDCEAAIVGGANLSLHPQSLVHYSRILKISMDGKTKSFDEDANGCAKSEAINVLFLQKAKDAMRIYADVLHVKSEFLSLKGDSGPRFGFYRDPLAMGQFLKTFYDEAGIPPQAVEYVEAFGSATPEADKAELEAISEVFCQNRQDPLLVGSVMSNIGYAEAATGISAITKVLLGYHKGELAANLHCSNPRKDIPALDDGRIRLVSDHETFRRTFTAVNSLSVTGCNAHVLLHGRYKPKDPSKYKTSIPYLVTISGRQETAVQNILDNLKSRPIDPEEIALLHNIHKMKITGHLGRGFTILDTDPEQKTISLRDACEYFDNARRPLWFVYSGMGSQWPGMGAQLMRIPVFANAIERCNKALKSKGLDITHIITSPDKTIFDNILHSFVGIAAVQIGLTDIIRELGLVPDKIIGHSVGELGCAYADGCLTTEEMILSAYSRGLVSVQTPFIHGSMAAVGIGYQEIVNLVPAEIEVACHNSSDSCTISGPSNVMREFVASLTAKGIFAKEVPCSNIAYHSRYIADAGPELLKYLSEVIKKPKPRSDRWLSTSVPQDKWNEPAAKLSSAEYHTNNLLNPVLFEETSRLIPSNAVLVEIAPHGLLQAILKRSLPSTCKHIPLTRRGHPDNSLLVLEAIGKLFTEGYNPKVEVLYPKVEFPVSTGTPFLSHLVQWAHNEKWNLPLYISACRKTAAACKYIVTVQDDEHKYLSGNIIRGKNVYPFAASLVAAWDTLAMSSGVLKKQLSVKFYNVRLFSQPILNHQLPMKLNVALHRGSGRFEIMEGNSKVATGIILASPHKSTMESKHDVEPDNEMIYTSHDIYQMLYEREFSYKKDFQSIYAANKSFSEAYLKWKGNWVTLIDGMLQLNVLRHLHHAVSQPAYIRCLSIDVNEHEYTSVINLQETTAMQASVCDLYDYTRCGGILMNNVKFVDLPATNPNEITLKTMQFVPRFQPEAIEVKTAVQIHLQIIAENLNKKEIVVIEVLDDLEDLPIIDFEHDDIPGLKVIYELISKKEFLIKQQEDLKKVDITLIRNLSCNEKVFKGIFCADSFIVSCEKLNSVHTSATYRVVSSYKTGDYRLDLARWKPLPVPTATRSVTVLSNTDLALLLSKKESLPSDQSIIVVTTYPAIDGMKELISQWRSSRKSHVYLVMVDNKITNDKIAVQMPYFDLAFNVLQHGCWGGVYYVPFAKQPSDVKGDAVLEIQKIGDLTSLHWVETSESPSDGHKIAVHYAGLNTIDAKKATGVYSEKNGTSRVSFGMDFSGISDSGEPVMGIVPYGACRKWVKSIPQLTWPVPSHWSLQEAASVPLPYAHAFYCLVIKTKVRHNCSILVHGGAGAFGQAAISISLGCGLQVFTTVSDVQKKHFLKKMFPALNENHIGCSRDHTFGDMVKTFTNGKGVDYVLNCVSGELRNISIKCANFRGVVIDIVQVMSNEDFIFGMYHMTNSRSYIAADFSSLFSNNNRGEMRKLQLLVADGIARGYVRPLTHVSYRPVEAARALRLLETSRHRGRVLLRLIDIQPSVHPRITCNPEQIHLILSDEEIYGLQLTERLVDRGARKIFLNLPKIHPSTFIRKQFWEKQGVEVKVAETNELIANKSYSSLLKEGIEMGPIEGIYFVSTTNNKTSREILSGMEIVSRKLCTSLKYFAVICADKNFGNRTCILRTQDRLPATKFTIPSIKLTEDSELTSTCLRKVLDLLETAVRQSDPVIFAQFQNETKRSLLQEIVAISDVKLPENMNDSAILKEIGVSEEKYSAGAILLRDKHNVCLNEEDIPLLSVQQIKDIERKSKAIEFEDAKGLKVFFAHVDSDELMASTEMVHLPTLTSSAAMRDDEEDMTQTNLCIVPGMEGNCERFRELCERIKIPALVLQPGLDFPNETIQELADRYAKVLLKRSSSERQFYLLGYESGVMVALETASILEEHGLTGTVYCIGAAPDEFKSMLEEELAEFQSDEELQNAIILHLFSLMLGKQCKLDLLDLTWQEKVERCVRVLLGSASLSAQYARAQFDAAYGRIKRARQYQPALGALRSRLVLLRASRTFLKDIRPLEEIAASELQRYSQQPISVHELGVPLAHALKDLRCAAVINQHLHPDILQEFQTKNLCETYLMNADTFMISQTLSDDS